MWKAEIKIIKVRRGNMLYGKHTHTMTDTQRDKDNGCEGQ